MTKQEIDKLRKYLTVQDTFQIITKSNYAVTNTTNAPVVFDDSIGCIIQVMHSTKDTGKKKIEVHQIAYEEIEHIVMFKTYSEAYEYINGLGISDDDKQILRDIAKPKEFNYTLKN